MSKLATRLCLVFESLKNSSVLILTLRLSDFWLGSKVFGLTFKIFSASNPCYVVKSIGAFTFLIDIVLFISIRRAAVFDTTNY